MEKGSNGESDDAQIAGLSFNKVMKNEIKVMVIQAVQQVILPLVEDIIRKVVKEEIQSAQDKILIGANRSQANEVTMMRERTLQLVFLEEVSANVLTGEAIKANGGTPVRVALVDKATGHIVENGPEASAEIEILILEAAPNDNQQSWTLKDFNDRIIKESEKKKPYIKKDKSIYLNGGVAILSDVKLGHDSIWKKTCECRLGVRLVGNLSGVIVKEAWTNSFQVLDRRSKFYKKHYPPRLSDKLGRLKNIAREGELCKRLNEQGIWTVQDFRFLHSIDPQRLQNILGNGAKWEATLEHAQTCIIDDQKMYLYNSPSSEFTISVVFDVLGQLKGVIRNSHYVPIVNYISQFEKDCAHRLLLLAFENRKDIISFSDETSLLHQFPYEFVPLQPRDVIWPDIAFDMGLRSSFSNTCSILEQFGDNQSLMSLIEQVNINPAGTVEVGSCSRQRINGSSVYLISSTILFFVRVKKRRLDRMRNVEPEDSHAGRRQRIC